MSTTKDIRSGGDSEICLPRFGLLEWVQLNRRSRGPTDMSTRDRGGLPEMTDRCVLPQSHTDQPARLGRNSRRESLLMTRHALTTIQDCEDFVSGCLFMGTGGGGGVDWGLGMLRAALQDGLPLEWTDLADIPDDAWTCTAFGMGSIAPQDDSTARAIEALGLVDRFGFNAMAQAVRELAAHTGKPISVIVPSELGAGNTPAPLVSAAQLGIRCVDGDYAGRAIPDEMQGTPYLYGKTSHPLASVDHWGDVVILKEAANPFMLERIGKLLSVAAYGSTYQAATLLPATEMKAIVVPGTLTRSLELGRAMRQAREAGADPISAAMKQTGGYLLFEGRVTGKDWEDRDGYMFGTTTIEGSGRFAGHTLAVWFKNENHVSWLDGSPWVCSPDLVVVADRMTGAGFTNTLVDAGDEVAVVGIRGLEGFRSERGLGCAGPRYFGFDLDYRPIEQLVERS